MSIGCFYISDFPAWAVRHVRQPQRPVIVLKDGSVCAATARARSSGVGVGFNVERAQAACPEALILPRQRSEELIAWEDVLGRIYEHTPRIEVIQPGLVYFEADPLRPFRQIAHELDVSGGWALRRATAYLAAVKAPVRHFIVVAESEVRRFLASFPTNLLRHVDFDEEMVIRLQQFGLVALHRLSQLTRRHLEVQFGSEGVRLHELLHPPADAPPISLYHPSAEIEKTYDFEHPFSAADQLQPALDQVLEESCEELGSRQCQRITLHLEADPPCRPSSRILREPTGDSAILGRLFSTLLGEQLASPPHRIDSLTIRLAGLCHGASKQHDFFARHADLQEAASSINERFPGMLMQVELDDSALFEDEMMRYVPLMSQ